MEFNLSPTEHTLITIALMVAGAIFMHIFFPVKSKYFAEKWKTSYDEWVEQYRDCEITGKRLGFSQGLLSLMETSKTRAETCKRNAIRHGYVGEFEPIETTEQEA